MLNAKQLRNKITAVVRAEKTLTANIHEICCNLVGHALMHGDVNLATLFIASMGSGVRHQAIVVWLETFGPFKLKTDPDTKLKSFGLHKEKKVEMLAKQDPAAWFAEVVEGATWASYTKEKVKSTYDIESVIEGAIKTAKSKVKKGEVVENVGLLEFVTQAVIKYHIAAAKADPESATKLAAAGTLTA